MNDGIDGPLGAALDDAFPGRDVADVGPAGISWNDRNETARVAFADGEAAYLKVATDGDGSRIARECAVIEYVGAHCDVAVPSVIASETDREAPYLATAPMRGRNLADGWAERSTDERAAAVRDVGAALAELHSCSFDRHGRITGGDATELAIETGTWSTVLVDEIESIREWDSTGRFDHLFDEGIAAVEANRDRLDDAPASLLHGDPAGPNCFRSDAAVGFVDWELAHVGDPARELHRAEEQLLYDDGERLEAALHEGYERRAGFLPDGLEERRTVYELVWHLNKLGVFDRWGETVDESPAEAVESVEARLDRLVSEL